jgi:hypothetical protein
MRYIKFLTKNKGHEIRYIPKWTPRPSKYTLDQPSCWYKKLYNWLINLIK